jgi:protein-L-isoaspartate(D-aspartate) O-methyltransferase
MSQPYTVAFMTDLLISDENPHFAKASRGKKVLEVGTGSGYQAAILSKLVEEVYTVEIIDKLAKRTEKILKKLKYKNVYVRSGSGEFGWKKHAPYDAIIVTCGVEKEIPQELFDQLKVGGVLVAPIGCGYDKTMTKFIKKKGGKIKKQKHGIFHFVPFVA